MEYLVLLLAQFIAVMAVVTLHEYAHAFAAYKCGDPTAKFAGRMSLNPMRHFDPLGIVMFAIAGFGWAKPVPINPNNFNDYKKGSLLTTSAGVIVNYLTAFLFYPLFVLVVYYVLPPLYGKYMATFLYYLFNSLVVFSLSFCVFNLLPFYPLDGFRIVDATSDRRSKLYWFLKRNGYQILLGLILIHFLASRIAIFGVFDILGYALDFAIGVFGKPITLFWNWIFSLFGVHVPFIF